MTEETRMRLIDALTEYLDERDEGSKQSIDEMRKMMENEVFPRLTKCEAYNPTLVIPHQDAKFRDRIRTESFVAITMAGACLGITFVILALAIAGIL